MSMHAYQCAKNGCPCVSIAIWTSLTAGVDGPHTLQCECRPAARHDRTLRASPPPATELWRTQLRQNLCSETRVRSCALTSQDCRNMKHLRLLKSLDKDIDPGRRQLGQRPKPLLGYCAVVTQRRQGEACSPCSRLRLCSVETCCVLLHMLIADHDWRGSMDLVNPIAICPVNPMNESNSVWCQVIQLATCLHTPGKPGPSICNLVLTSYSLRRRRPGRRACARHVRE